MYPGRPTREIISRTPQPCHGEIRLHITTIVVQLRAAPSPTPFLSTDTYSTRSAITLMPTRLTARIRHAIPGGRITRPVRIFIPLEMRLARIHDILVLRARHIAVGAGALSLAWIRRWASAQTPAAVGKEAFVFGAHAAATRIAIDNEGAAIGGYEGPVAHVVVADFVGCWLKCCPCCCD